MEGLRPCGPPTCCFERAITPSVSLLIAATITVLILALVYSFLSANHGSAVHYRLIQYPGTGAPPAAAPTHRTPVHTMTEHSYGTVP